MQYTILKVKPIHVRMFLMEVFGHFARFAVLSAALKESRGEIFQEEQHSLPQPLTFLAASEGGERVIFRSYLENKFYYRTEDKSNLKCSKCNRVSALAKFALSP